MNTILLSDEEVTAYLADLWERLVALKDKMPMLWCPIGPSGLQLARIILRAAGGRASEIAILPVAFDRKSGEVSFPSDPGPSEIVKGKRVLLLDASIHSGNTFGKVLQAVALTQPMDISSYALVARMGSAILPNWFGLMIGDHDRALFLKKTIPNNRLFEFGCVRKLADADQTRPKLRSGAEFIDKFSWDDLLYEMMVDPRRQTYVYEHLGKIKAYVSFRVIPGDDVVLDTIATDKPFQHQGIAGNLMRWAETCGRNRHCGTITLWAVDSEKDWYRKRGYEFRGKEFIIDGVKFHLTRKKLLYNLPDDNTLTMGA